MCVYIYSHLTIRSFFKEREKMLEISFNHKTRVTYMKKNVIQIRNL